ncbi:MAG: bifunctional folylpolyglutamate synthase/dihydrofolate synthase [Verrucomicrobia bacterium]|nr:bifunctional folylpolyglutamate synthase/dihydrofolate synthase [Verrucomicrobiota bacterium]
MKYGSFERAKQLNAALNFPTRAYPTIHVAGTNGKGSVSTKIAKALELSGYRVGLFTSPHLFSFSERITINSRPIPEQVFEERIQQIPSPCFFERATFLAFDYFRQEKVDIAVIETGLGGRLDTTNVIHPILTVITSISRDHAELLGNTLDAIAREKAGILKPKIPVVIGPKAQFQPIFDRAQELECPLYISEITSPFFDVENSALAKLTLKQIPLPLTSSAIEQALQTRPPCRFEKVGDVLYDVAHNIDATIHLLQALEMFFPDTPCRFLVGYSEDKEYASCLALLQKKATHLHLVQAEMPRAASPKKLRETLPDQMDATLHKSVAEGAVTAYQEAQKKGELLVISGSFYIMADARHAIELCKTQEERIDLSLCRIEIPIAH